MESQWGRRSSHESLDLIAHICTNMALFQLTCVLLTVSSSTATHLAPFPIHMSIPLQTLHTDCCCDFSVAGDFTKCYCLRLKESEFFRIFLMVQMLLLQVMVSRATAAWARRREEVRGQRSLGSSGSALCSGLIWDQLRVRVISPQPEWNQETGIAQGKVALLHGLSRIAMSLCSTGVKERKRERERQIEYVSLGTGLQPLWHRSNNSSQSCSSSAEIYMH